MLLTIMPHEIRQAPKPSAGPHRMRECMPLIVMLRERLKYALTYHEVKMIVMQRLIKVDGKVRTDMFFPAGFMDVVQIEKTKENFRMMYDTKGRFAIHKVVKEEAAYKLCRVRKLVRGPKGTPYAITHDGRTLRYPDPAIKARAPPLSRLSAQDPPAQQWLWIPPRCLRVYLARRASPTLAETAALTPRPH